jgi:hypothetical protein
MNESFWDRVEGAWNLGSAAFVCLAIVVWIGARACYAFFKRGDLLFAARFLALVDPAAATTNPIADEKPDPGQNKQGKSHRACPGYWIPIWGESDRSTGQRVLIAVGWRIYNGAWMR